MADMEMKDMEEMTMCSADGEDDPKRETFLSLYEWIEAAIFSLVCVVLVFAFAFRIVGVDGESMQYTLMDQDRLILTSFPYTPDYGDIVVINRYTQEPLVKRVIALEGDTIEITEDEQVMLNGEILNEPYLNVSTPPREMNGPFTVPEGCVFVMGDNRHNSHDSRYMDLRCISTKDIMGKAVFRIWPFSQIGGLYDDD